MTRELLAHAQELEEKGFAQGAILLRGFRRSLIDSGLIPPVLPVQKLPNRGEEEINQPFYLEDILLTSEADHSVEFTEKAKKLAMVQQEILARVSEYPLIIPVTDFIRIGDYTGVIRDGAGGFSVSTKHKQLSERWHDVEYFLSFGTTGWTKDAKGRYGIEADFALVLQIYSDKPTQEQFDEWSDKASEKEQSTVYLFSEDGSYGKVIHTKGFLIKNRKSVYEYPNIASGCYFSEMTEEDFEIAERALGFLLDRLNNPDETVKQGSTLKFAWSMVKRKPHDAPRRGRRKKIA